MPTAKGKGGAMSHRYRPASEYDDATLAQKREYWRIKKREQRARLSKWRGKPPQGSQGKKLLHLNVPAVVGSSLSGSCAAFTSPLQSNDESYKTPDVSPASQSGNTAGGSSAEAAESQKEKWLQTMNLNKVSPQSPASCSISAKAKGSVSRAVTSPTPSETQLNTSSSVPVVRVTRIRNGSSTKTTPQPCVSMQGASVPKTKQKAQVALRIQPKLLPTNVTTGIILVSSPRVETIETEGKTVNATPQSGTKSALVTSQRAKCVHSSQPPLESEEERAAKRREHWRLKKREQRAKVAAQTAKARERTQTSEMTLQRQAAQKPGPVGSAILQNIPPQSFLRGAGQRQCPPRVKTLLSSTRKENYKLRSVKASLATVNLQADQIEVQNPHGNNTTQMPITSDVLSVKRPQESQRKLYVQLHNISRGIVRCKTPRQRFIEAQKNFINQRNIRCKSPLLASVFGSRNIPKMDPDDAPEQIIAKRREYWRVKKREQRAKQSMEVKARLKEKDSLTRRVKRYQNILEEMRRARALTQSAGSPLTQGSETIGGFIKEDGTVTINASQVPTGHRAVTRSAKEESHVVSQNTSITKPQYQPDTEQRGITPIQVSQCTPPLCQAQVKVTFPLARQSVNKPPRPLSIKPRPRLESTTASNSPPLAVHTVGQLTLTHPQNPESAVSGGSTVGQNQGGCVMKMAVSSNAPSPSTLSLDPELTEEERMAKKREYWRIKKREQRAARAARLKQGVLQRRKAQKQIPVTTVLRGRKLTRPTANARPLPNNSVPIMPHASEVKQECESLPAVDLNFQLEQAICPDINPPTTPPPPPPPAAHQEPDPAVNADNQATTLLAVASMKKLLEESLSTVTECKSTQTDIKTEPTEEASDSEKPNLPQLFFEKDEVAPIAADLTLEIKSWQPDTDALVQEGSLSPYLKDASQISKTPPPLPTSSQEVLYPSCENSSQTPTNFIVDPSMEASEGPSSPRTTQRLPTKKAGHQNCCSPEPPKLHHLPIDQPQPQQLHREQQCQAQEQCHSRSSPPAQKYCSVATEHSGSTSLQKKREYWKQMKRMQRARLKARQKNEPWEYGQHYQAPGLMIINTIKDVKPPAKPALQPKPSIASLTAVTSVPTVLVVSPTTYNAEQSPDRFQVKLPVSCSHRSQQNMNVGPSHIMSNSLGAPENEPLAMAGSRKWVSRNIDVDSASSLPTLKPPDNPLSSINLQPIEPPGQLLNSTLSPIKISQLQTPTQMTRAPNKLASVSTMAPPKPIPGESEEDFLKRKREYWRIKKKEQRARRAIQEKGITSRKASNNRRPILPAPDVQTQEYDQWVNSSEESEHLMSSSVHTDPGSFAYSNYTGPVEDEPDPLLAEYETNNGEEDPVSEVMWRSSYLMDYDPLNQLLVCMVCGELQYSHSLEGVRAHIDEAHPDTLTLEPAEQQRILEAWDEQVSQRERFFTSQLQQHSGALAEAHGN